MALGLAAALMISPFVTGASLAAEQEKEERVYTQLERLNLQPQKFQTSELTKEQGDQFSENQLVIKYSSPLSTSEHRKAGGKLVKRFATLGYDVIEVQGNKKIGTVVNGYAQLAKVTSIARSAYGKTLAVDPKINDMYHIKTLNLSKAQKLAGKNKVKVAVIDTGLDAKHPELKNRLTANININDPMKKGSPDIHGTHVAGIIAGEKNNGIGGFGVAPNSQIVSIDVSNRSFFITDYIVAEGILEAIRQKVKVINMSLGFYYPSPILKDAVKKAIDSGITVVAAAGNDGASVLNYPASFEDVISVGATDSQNKLAFFSTYGASVDVVAPGHNVYAPVYDVDKGSSFTKMSGTSMASPVVAGAVSLLLSKYPNLTPYQVNYMVTETAKDLGEKGYDLKYGFGLIDPVKLLSFDPKKIPANSMVKEEKILEKANKLGTFENKEIIGKIYKLNQADLYSVTMDKGEYVQATLSGVDNYDMKFKLLFFEDGKLTKSVEVNDVRESVKEGALFQAPADGTLVVSVKDSFGKYGEAGEYIYKLSLEKGKEFLDEEQSMENPVAIAALPYQSPKHFFKDELSLLEESLPEEEESTRDNSLMEQNSTRELEEPTSEIEEGKEEPGDEEDGFRGIPGDSDFFRFIVPGSQDGGLKAVKINLSGVSGIDSSLVLYAVEKMNGQELTYEMERVSFKGYGKGEELIFNAVPGHEYLLEVTNKPYIDEFMLMLGDFEINYERNYSSLQPYFVSIEAASLPNDEDGIPLGNGFESPEKALVEGDYEQYFQNKKAIQEEIDNKSNPTFNERVQQIKDAAISIDESEKKEGYIQTYGDEDWFAFTPTHSSTFEVNIDKSYPVAMSILKFDKDMEDFTFLYSNSQFLSFDEISNETNFHVGLQANETYYFVVTDPMYRPGFKPYRFSIKSKVQNTADSFESNDSFDTASKISTKAVYGNYAGVRDIDMFYFKPGKKGVYTAKVTPGEFPKNFKNVPVRLQSQIDPVMVIVEDKNGNGKLDKEEEGNQIYVDFTSFNEEERTGFRTEKGSGYFIITFDYFGVNSSLNPYVLKIDETNRKDEDQGSTVKNNIPSKPLVFGKDKKAKGYINRTTNQGDSDYYKFNLPQSKKVKITLEVPTDIDGILTIYSSKGNYVMALDNYAKGDNEIHEISLSKGTYYIKVEDVFGNASTDPYTLKVQ